MPRAKAREPAMDEWQPRHQQIVVAVIIDIVVPARTSIYSLPGLAGEVNGHGGEKIRSRVNQILKKMADDIGVKWSVGSGGTGAGTKRKLGSGEGKAKAKKAKKVEEEEVKGEDEDGL
ncbi:hypothetical protein P7C73_g3397, partial [Tremellales sp. Uapishka_1]